MPYSRPSIDDIIRRMKADAEAIIEAVRVVRSRTPLDGILRGVSCASHEAHSHINWVYRQLFPDTAERDQLVRHASFQGLVRRPAGRATGSLTFTGNDGTAIPSGTRLAVGGVEIETTEAAVVANGTAIVSARAILDGSAGMLATEALAIMLSPVAGLASQARVAAPGFSGGADVEDDAALLDRLLFEIRNPPHGGASSDYTRWALEVPGVTQAWPSPLELGLGTVTLRFAVDDADHGPIPTSAEVETVNQHILDRGAASALREGRPVTAQLFVVPPVAAPVDIVLEIDPDTAANRTAIRAEIAALFRRTAVPGGTVSRDRIGQSVSLAPGLIGSTLVAPAADALPAVGHLPTLGEVTFRE